MTAPTDTLDLDRTVVDHRCQLRARQVASERTAQFDWQDPTNAHEFEQEQYTKYYHLLRVLTGLSKPTPIR